jgi:hypothetical protein
MLDSMRRSTLFALLLVLPAAPAAAQMGPPMPMTAAQFASSPTGQNVILAVRVNRVARTTVSAEQLERVNDTTYKKTGRAVTLYLPAETPFIMGSGSDVKTGAIIFVYAVTTTAAHADVKKVIVVTPYARVQ